jgi:ActR/RegA family two-component response regulator
MQELYGGIEPELCDGVAPPILLVDDDLALAQTMALAIENVGIPVEHCTSGETAIQWIRDKRYAVVVLDLILGEGVSGLYVVDAIREMRPEQRPMILMTTGANLEGLRGVDRSMVAAVILKPVDFGLFADYVLATYRRAIHATSEVAAAHSLSPAITTYCGDCGAEITPWIFNPPHPASGSDTFELWLDTPCSRCGTSPRHAGGRSDWTPRAHERARGVRSVAQTAG